MSADIKKKLLDQFHKLIADGKELLDGKFPYAWALEVDRSRYVLWRTQVINLLERVLPAKSTLRKRVGVFLELRNSAPNADEILSTLTATESDFDNGMFDDIEKQIEASISVNYLGQAEMLVRDSDNISNSHIPAAVLAGVVLEKNLRTLCLKNNPQISLKKAGGKDKTLNSLINDLKATSVLNEIYAKQLRAWADIRNAAAHGRFTEFSKEQVAAMIEGINQFLLNYMQ